MLSIKSKRKKKKERKEKRERGTKRERRKRPPKVGGNQEREAEVRLEFHTIDVRSMYSVQEGTEEYRSSQFLHWRYRQVFMIYERANISNVNQDKYHEGEKRKREKRKEKQVLRLPSTDCKWTLLHLGQVRGIT